MPAPLSIIIPTLNSEAALKEILPGIMEGVATGLMREVIVSDGGSTDETVALAIATGAEVVTGAPGRGGQLGRGAAVARGDWLLFLHDDTHLPQSWPDVVLAAMADSTNAHVFRLSFRATGFAPKLVAGWANFRTRLLRLPFGDQGMLIARTQYENLGGYPDIPLMEDVALARALAGKVKMLGEPVSTSAERYQQNGWLRQGCRNISIQAKFYCGVSPDRLARSYKTSQDGEAPQN